MTEIAARAILGDMRISTALSLPLCALVASAAAAKPAVLEEVGLEPGWVILQMSRPAGYRTQAQGSTLVVTFSDAEVSPDVRELSSAGGMVRKVNAVNAEEDGVSLARVTIELDMVRDYMPAWNGKELTLELKGPPAAAPAAPAAPAAAAPRAAPAAKAAAKKAFRVQLGSFAKEAQAARLKTSLGTGLGPLEVVRAETAGKTVYRVVLGPFDGKPAAKAAMEKAAAQGHAGLLVRE